MFETIITIYTLFAVITGSGILHSGFHKQENPFSFFDQAVFLIVWAMLWPLIFLFIVSKFFEEVDD